MLSFVLLLMFTRCLSAAAIYDSSLETVGSVFEGELLAPGIVLDMSTGDLALREEKFTYVAEGEQKRTNVKGCLKAVGAIGGVAAMGITTSNMWYSAFKYCAGTIYDQSKHSNCGVSHSVTPNGKIKYVYASSGSCHTSAMKQTIQGALDKSFNAYVTYDPNGIYCMELTHYGQWHGYLLIGPNGDWPAGLSCGSNHSGKCVSGGVNDVHH